MYMQRIGQQRFYAKVAAGIKYSRNRMEHHPRTDGISLSSKHEYPGKRKTRIDLGLNHRSEDVQSSQLNFPCNDTDDNDEEFSLPTQFGKRKMLACVKASKSSRSHHNSVEPFDICLPNSNNSLQASFQGNNEEHTIEESRGGVLRPGMVLLKHYIDHDHQVEIVKTCREIGMGRGGFYRPGYQDGAKLRLHMMCLGLNWDPQTRKYEDQRSFDSSEPPGIPHKFNMLVQRVIRDAHSLIERNCNPSDMEKVLPAMSPNVCIVNFYTTTGRIGLHQDRDESAESLCKGLPVVSVSVGDSAEFLYGDQRDVDKAEKVVLESGDVLIFGGNSRHIFHGVKCVIPNSAPKALLEEARLRPGRLNLTFREY